MGFMGILFLAGTDKMGNDFLLLGSSLANGFLCVNKKQKQEFPPKSFFDEYC